MNILLIAPQPFFQERGTPIAVDLLLRALSEQGHHVDLLVFNEGEDRIHPNTTINRVKSFPILTDIKPGFSLKKIYLDFWLFFKFLRMLMQKKYDVVHAVEESAFFAIMLRPFFKYQTVFDVDSSMSTQLIDKSPIFKKMEGVLRFIESLPMKKANAVVAVCDALAQEVYQYRNDNVYILKDIDLSQNEESQHFTETANENLRDLFAQPSLPLFMYIGNLESYQGIDLMLESFAKTIQNDCNANLIIIGGEQHYIEHYQKMSVELAINNNTVFAGKRPVKGLGYFMSQADALVSPRTQGVNTPMKVYSYLASGKPVLATKLPTHTQVMTDEIAVLAEANTKSFATAMQGLIGKPESYLSKAVAAAEFIEKEHSYNAFSTTLEKIYRSLEQQTKVDQA